MEEKYNESTELRPEGGRLLDAALVSIDVPDFIQQLKNEPAWDKSDRNAMTLYKTEGMRIVLIALHEDAVLTRHIAQGIISVQVLEGKIKFVTEQQTSVVEKGQMLALHKNITHSVLALAESFFLLTLAVNK